MLVRFVFFLLLFAVLFIIISNLYDLFTSVWMITSIVTNTFLETDLTQDESQFSVVKLDDLITKLSEDQLAQLLAHRGLPHRGNETRSQLTNLVKATHPEQVDFKEFDYFENVGPASAIKTYLSSSIFEEDVEYNRQVMLVYVFSSSSTSSFHQMQKWFKSVEKLNKFVFRYSSFDCSHDPSYCLRKNWYSPRILLILPNGNSLNGNTVHEYNINFNQKYFTDWLREHITKKITVIQNEQSLRSDWIGPNLENHKLVAIFPEQFRDSLPHGLALMSLRFHDRIDFGTYFVSLEVLKQFHKEFNVNGNEWTPIYLIVYGSK